MDNYFEDMLMTAETAGGINAQTENSFDAMYLGRLPLAMAYVPFQRWGPCIYEPYRALQRGTIFPELDLPFCGRELV